MWNTFQKLVVILYFCLFLGFSSHYSFDHVNKIQIRTFPTLQKIDCITSHRAVDYSGIYGQIQL